MSLKEGIIFNEQPVLSPPPAPTPAPAVPAPHQAEVSTDEQSVFTVGLIVMVLVLVTWVIAAMLGAKYTADRDQAITQVAQLDQQLADPLLTPTITKYDTLVIIKRQMASLRASRFAMFPTWDKIKSSVPKDVQFSNVTIDSNKTYRISGAGKSFSTVANFAKALEEKTELTKIAPVSIERPSGSNLFNYTVTFKANKPTTTTKNEATQ